MVAGGDFTVEVLRRSVVSAPLPLQEHWLPQSNLDLLLPPLDFGVFFCYRKPTPEGSSLGDAPSKSLKAALAESLISFYVLAGEVVSNQVGEPELLCNNRGVEFVEARANVELVDLELYNPDESVEGKLVPKKKQGVVAVQVTELKCGGLVVGCAFDHRVTDAYSANMFIVSWAEIARSSSSSSPPVLASPSFRRSLLNPRRPLSIDPYFDQMYVPITSMPKPPDTVPDRHQLMSRIYYVTSHELEELQHVATSEEADCKRSKLESFSAFLWKILSNCYEEDSRGRINGTDTTSIIGIVVDGRTRLGEGKGTFDSYFGNVLSIPFGEMRIADAVSNPLSKVADEVHKFLGHGTSGDHFRGLIDWVETRRPQPGLTKVYCRTSEDGPAFVVSSGQRFPASKADFGWGKPVFGSYHFPWGGTTGYIMPMPSLSVEGDWVVYMHVSKYQVEYIEREAPNFFKPLTPSYLFPK
ncbi:hypothetical protein MLD38_010892 [Melastoma candidum]|uniref:Uncharacterized protein n=1 Tax=Melastoma candidum TaxID=119954 RepID=A0ACB9R5G5_9MYRT|nr:hypothetical protein MLD38_010892 [Melastoma candidum]